VDYSLERWINAPAGSHPLWDALVVGFAAGAETAFVALVALWFLVGWLRRLPEDRRGAVAALLAAGGALAANQVLAALWNRPRPFVTHPDQVHQLLAHGADSSFPSDHAAAAFAIATVLFAHHRRLGLLALAAAALVGYARVYVGDHYPADVLSGAAIGVVVGLTLVRWIPLVPRFASRLVDEAMVRLGLLHNEKPRA
jgi:undecaprenyl-diphosphatase